MSGIVAAVDCGTNTLKLLIGEPPEVLVRETRLVRLGEGVDTSGVLAEGALARAFAAIEEYAALIERYPVRRVRFCATSATRDAANSDVFAAGVRDRLGVVPDVLSGSEEAALSFAGAVRHLRVPTGRPVLVLDIGGGSTELILGHRAADRAEPALAHSMDVGSVRLHERHLRSDPPTSREVAAAVADVDAALDACPVPPALAGDVVGVAGTVLTVGARVLDLPAYDLEAIDQARLPVGDVHAAVEQLVAMSLAERLALPYLVPGRADVIGAGALILDRVLRRARVDTLLCSVADILDGIAWSIA